MTSTFKGFLYWVAGKLATYKLRVKLWFTLDSIVLSQEQMVTINGVCGKTKNVQYLSIIQDHSNKNISLRVQGVTPDGSIYVTDSIPIDIYGQPLVGKPTNEIAH